MLTFTALTTLPGQELAEALAEALEVLDPVPIGVGIFEMEDGSCLWEVGAYFTATPDDIALSLLAAAHGARPFAVSEVPDTDWVAAVKRCLHPVVAGRFFVYGSHDADQVPPDAIPLLIEAAMAFGTGHHGTTKGCLEALDALLEGGVQARNVADIGCGTAVLGMAAAKVWPGTVIVSDIDPVAVDVARANAAANGLDGRLICIEAAGFDHPDLAARAPYDLIFANILMGPLITLAPEMSSNASQNGHLILSGLLNEQADAIVTAYDVVGFALIRRKELGEWTTLTLMHQ
jgi:ribosomal protein L11 methyltransferase